MFIFNWCCRGEVPTSKKKSIIVAVEKIKTPFSINKQIKADPNLDSTIITNKDRYEGEELNGKPHGNGSMLYANGDFYRGQWVIGVKQGRGLQIYQQLGRQYEGEWHKNLPYGNGKLIFHNNSYYIGQFQNGLKHGAGTYHDMEKKRVFQQIYSHGQLKEQKQIAIVKSKDEEFPTLVLDKQRFNTDDLQKFEDANLEVKQLELQFLLKYYCLQFIAKNVKQWTIKQVIDFLNAIELKGYKEIFYKNKIKGKDLITLNEKQLRDDLKMKLGDRKKFISYINYLIDLERQNHSLELLKKRNSKTKKQEYRLRSATSMKNVLRNVKNNPIYAESIRQHTSQSDDDSQEYRSNRKIVNYTSENAGNRNYDTANLGSIRSLNSSEQKQDYFDKMIDSFKYENNSENSKKRKDSKDNMGNIENNNHHNHNNFNHNHSNHKNAIYRENSNKDQMSERQAKTPQKASSSSSSSGVQIDLTRKRTHASSHQATEIRELYEFLKQHRSLDFLIKEKDIEKLQQIGQGGYGKVYKAKYIGSLIAVKDYMKTGKHHHKEDFMKEVEVISDLKHPNIVLYMGMCITANKYTLITEYLENGSLFDQLHQKKKKFSDAERIQIVNDIVKGMVYLHNMKNVIHRDLKSSNVLIGEDWKVKLCDFGLSGQKKKQKKNNQNRIGTYQWMAPEVIRNEQIDFSSDVYSFGVIIWQLLTQKIPYEGLHESQIVGLVGYDNTHGLQQPKGDPFLINIMKKCLKRLPQERPSFMQIQTQFNNHEYFLSSEKEQTPLKEPF